MKTIKELENQLKISKVSIYNMIKKNEFKGHVFKGEDNITLVDEIGVELLKIHYLKEQGKTIDDIIVEEIDHSKDGSKASSKDDSKVENADTIRILQQQLEIKDEQINNLLNIVLNQQKLQATQYLTDNQSPIDNAESSEQTDIKSSKENIFKRIFGKK